MLLELAPFFTDVHPGPEGGRAYWAHTADGVRIRLGYWPADAARGTVFLFAGRTEYIEKYGVSAGELASRGLATLTIDWRGQGLADRALDEPRIGHVAHFSDYQKDVASMVDAARALDLPKPYFLLGHSMGGCIGLRSLIEHLPVESAVFSGPMWGIRLSALQRLAAYTLPPVLIALGMGQRLAPTSSLDHIVFTEPFEHNTLTRDREMFNMMRDQINAHPELSLGGPSVIWLHEALRETNHLARLESPQIPSLTILGSDEKIVDIARIKKRLQNWGNNHLHIVEGGRHEALLEGPAIRQHLFDQIARHFLQTFDT